MQVRSLVDSNEMTTRQVTVLNVFDQNCPLLTKCMILLIFSLIFTILQCIGCESNQTGQRNSMTGWGLVSLGSNASSAFMFNLLVMKLHYKAINRSFYIILTGRCYLFKISIESLKPSGQQLET